MSDSRYGRRDVLRSAAVAGGVVGLTGLGAAPSRAQEDEFVETFELIGRQPGWEGVSPSSIEGETNPTLEIDEIGGRYRVVWENGDGMGHNFVIESQDGEDLLSTEIISSGEQTVEFEATAEMAEYYCMPHPASMRGDLATGDAGGGSDGQDGGDGQDGSDARDDALQALTDECDFVLDGRSDGWVGIAPGDVEGETNPALEVEAGEEYTLGWINGDGTMHDVGIWTADGERLDDTTNVSEEGTTQTLTFEASAETASYGCEVHPDAMAGSLDVQGADASDDADSDDTPGFGVLAAIVGLGGGAAARLRRGE